MIELLDIVKSIMYSDEIDRSLKLSFYFKVKELWENASVEQGDSDCGHVEGIENHFSEMETFFPFEIVKKSNSLWIPFINGDPVKGLNILPFPLVYFIVNKGLANSEPFLRLVSFKGKSYRLSFSVENDVLITGTIQEMDRKGGEVISESDFLDKRPVEDFETFLKYILDNEELYQYFLSEFTFRWKPQIDGKRSRMKIALPQSNTIKGEFVDGDVSLF